VGSRTRLGGQATRRPWNPFGCNGAQYRGIWRVYTISQPCAQELRQKLPLAFRQPSLALRSRSALAITVTELKLIAALAIIGERSQPVSG
jgi:hypothetical protein